MNKTQAPARIEVVSFHPTSKRMILPEDILKKTSFLKKNSTTEKIVSILTRFYSLTARQIHQILEKTFKNAGTYQATHKQLKKLCQDQVLKKNNGKYSLNLEWLKKTSNEMETLIKKLEKTVPETIINNL
ncbi:MAG: hypothetical protein HY917_05120 [Candidatus Diapherotrites archaeon]|nr:hypothetical protein [Candidatus Diapherotrites archaeon]